MFARLAHFFSAFLFLVALSLVYQNLITPMMQAPKVPAIALAKGDATGGTDESLKDLFPEGAWQLGVCKQLKTADGMLLFQNWKQTKNDRWKLWPVTVIMGRGMSSEQSNAPLIIEAELGAEIEFTESLDMMSGGAPPIHNGRMIGPVHISRLDPLDNTRDLDIQTANVGIDKRKIWTTETIEIQVGQAQMVGRDLTIHIAGPSATGSGGAAAILDRMELIYLDRLVIPLADGGLWDAMETPAESESTAKSLSTVDTEQIDPAQPAAMLSLECGGRVEYDFAMDVLSLSDAVSLIHQVHGRLTDRFDCDTLKLRLNDPTNKDIQRLGPMDWLIEIVATGSPVVARLPSFDTEIAAEKIVFHAIEGTVHAEGSKGIRIRRGSVTARLARIDYRFNPKQPQALGEIDAPGPGIVLVDDPELPLRKAQWHDGFRLRPVGVATADNIDTDVHLWVDGDVHAWLTDGGEFSANSIAGELTPIQGADGKTTLVPNRFKIAGDVRIDTTAIAAETNELLLHFISEADPLPKSTNDTAKATTSPLRQWVVQPTSEGTMVAPVARPRPTIRGDKIHALLRRNESGLSAKKLSVVGNVVVTHQLKTAEKTLPVRLTGQSLRLIDGGGEDVLQLEGTADTLARFEIGDGFFVGPQIQIRPSDNVVWINSAGEFQMPTAALPTGFDGQTNENLRWIHPPHCRWLGEMIFDGRTAVLTDGVDITASLVNGNEPWDLHMTGDRLQVDLLNDVKIRDMKAMRGASVQRVSLMQGNDRPVMVQALRRSADGQLESKHLIHARQLTMTPDGGGQIVGQGPGWYRGWMVPGAGNTLLGMTPADPSKPNDPGLRGIHLVFNDSMRADMAGRHLDFLRGVRVGVRPVQSWEEAFDAQTMDAISMGDSTLDCDRLRFNIEPGYESSQRTPGSPPPWEMEATSGVVFRTRNDRGLIEGTASRASYSSKKDLFTVDGAPNRAAIFRQTRPDGSRGPEGAVRTMSIRPGSMTLENLVLERLNIATPPTSSNR